jgi:hypothetical protein
MAKRDKKTIREEQTFIIHKKAQFDPVEDGVSKLGEAALRHMAAHWVGSQDAMISPAEELAEALQKALRDEARISRILDRLPKRASDLLHFLHSEGGQLSLEELRPGFPLRDKEELQSILRPLTQCGLVWELRTSGQDERSARLAILPSAAAELHLPSFLEGKLGEILPQKGKEQFLALAGALGGDGKQLLKRREIFAWLKGQLRNPVRLRRLFESFDINERKLLKIISLRPDGVTLSELKYDYSLFSSKDPDAIVAKALEHLHDGLGVVYSRPVEEPRGAKKEKIVLYRLPRELGFLIQHNFREKYRDEFPRISIFKPPDEDFALSSRSRERSALWVDFQQLLNHLIRCEVGVIRKGGMHKKNLKRILDRLEGKPVDAYHYLDFLFLYAYEREILYPVGERWLVNVKNLAGTQDEATFCHDFWAFYRNNASWNDRDSSPLQGVLQKGDSAQVFSLRRAILRMLWDCPVGQWLEMKVFFDTLCDREEVFRSGEIAAPAGDPVRERYRFLKATLERSLTWLGAADTTTISAKRTDLFRVTEIGSWLLRGTPDKPPFPPWETSEVLHVQGNFEIIMPSNFPLEKQLYLARFTDDHKGRMLITRASLRRGLEESLSVQEMLDFLQTHNQAGDIPGNIEHLMHEVVEKTGNIFVGGEPFRLEVSDKMLLDELLLQKRFLPFIQERSDAKKAILRRGTDLEKLMEELKSAGYSPRTM